MARITDADVSSANDQVAQAENAEQARAIVDGFSKKMLSLLLDLNHLDPDHYGLGERGRIALLDAHGWQRLPQS